MASPSADSSSPSILQSPTFPHELAHSSLAKRQAYAAAAAEARRKRRRALVRRRTSGRPEPPTPLSSPMAAPTMEDAPAVLCAPPATAAPIVFLKQPVAAAATSFCSPGKRQRFDAAATITIAVVHPDVEGIADLGERLCRGERVAVPTECTYEVLQQHQPSSSHLQLSAAAAATATATTTSIIALAKPHIYINDVAALDTCQFWRQVFAKKSYAIRQSGERKNIGSVGGTPIKGPFSATSTNTSTTTTTTTTVATFNESVQVVYRVASKVWPGPVLVYVQVQQPIPGLTHTVNAGVDEQCYTSESNVRHYLALRRPCHPLTVRICREFYGKQQPEHYKKVTAATPPSSPPLAPLPFSPPSPPPMYSRVTSCGSLSTAASSSSLSAGQLHHHPSLLLVGVPLVLGHQRSSEGQLHAAIATAAGAGPEYVTAAARVADAAATPAGAYVTAVLDGEERRETFAVPTCEHGRPWPVSIWIDADDRTVRLRTAAAATAMTHGAAAAAAVSFRSHDTGGGVAALTAATLRQSLRATTATSVNPSSRDRVLQAVLHKWKVVAEYR